MRKNITGVIFVLGFYFSACSQKTIPDVQISKMDNLQSDSVNTSDNTEFENKAGLKPIDKTQNSYEIRFYKTEELSGERTLKVLYSTDLCAHGHVFVKIGDEVIADKDSLDMTVSATALYLMRTLKDNYKKGYYASQLLPC
ncbi:hypothetical protein [Algoriphagus sp. Y33]|uniref:hypothetical protein n=1 Tax=Algoriphagus sp. Y33 TaxID=2772483 RepID=UPI001CE140EF|nr:hypothetical protein [Algoriphagus sp. Y33]